MKPEEIENATFPTSRRGYDPESVREFLALVADSFRQVIRFPPPGSPPPPPPPPPEPRGYADQIGDEVASIVDFAAQAAQELRSKAERDAETIRRAATEEAAEAAQVAMRQLELAQETKAEAEREADAIRAAGRSDASRIEQEARASAALVQREVLEKAAQLERAVNTNIGAVLGEARKRYEQLRNAQQHSLERLGALETLVLRAMEEARQEEPPPEVHDLLAGPLPSVNTSGRLRRSGSDAEAEDSVVEPPSPSRTARSRPDGGPHRSDADRRVGSRRGPT